MKRNIKRIMLKLSGEALMGSQKFGQDPDTILGICQDIKEVYDMGFEIAIVVGAGNICRGASAAALGIDRISADYMGMLATVMNALAMQSTLEKLDIRTRVLSAITMTSVCEPFIRRRAIRHMEKGRIIILAAGTGSPFFTTDTGAVLRATEISCDMILKGTQVDGVYSADPKIHPDATKYDTITFKEVLSKELKFMDVAAISLARDNKIPIMIFNIRKRGELAKVLQGSGSFTVVNND
jgi:uridylate kinase